MKSTHSYRRLPFSLMAFALMAMMVISACGKDPDDPDNPDPDNPEELITSLVFNYTDTSNATNTFTFAYRDADGDGGAAPTQFDTLRFPANTTYNSTLEVLNESDPNDVEDVTLEILAEDDEHLFCYTVDGADLEVIRTDSDGNFPIGISTRWRAGDPGTGTIKVVLKHQPGVKDGSCAPGDTDIELDFVVEIL